MKKVNVKKSGPKKSSKSAMPKTAKPKAAKAKMPLKSSSKPMQVPSMRQIKPSEYFVLANGDKIKSLVDLKMKLEKMDDGLFYSHVNNGKNDFATWVYHAVGDQELASRLGPLKAKADNLKAVAERIKAPMPKSAAPAVKK